jgi:hypothetical protein
MPWQRSGKARLLARQALLAPSSPCASVRQQAREADGVYGQPLQSIQQRGSQVGLAGALRSTQQQSRPLDQTRV